MGFPIFKNIYSFIYRWFNVPQSSPEINQLNFRNVQIDAIGVGLASTAVPFLPVLLARLGASTLEVSMLTFMPALTGVLLAIPLGNFLETRKNIIPWFSFARLGVLLSYGFTGLLVILLPEASAILGILGLWAVATVPQTILAICFSVVMNKVAGSRGRFELMSHRWSILGFTNAGTALIAGQFLDRVAFPLNYQILFITLSIGGIISFYFSSKIVVTDNPPQIKAVKRSLKDQVTSYGRLILNEKPFVSFIWKRFVFLTGAALAAPLLPLYYVRALNASDYWIALIHIASNTTVIIGYFFWMNQSRRRGSKIVLLATTLGSALYPVLVGISQEVWPVVIFAALNGIFQAGLNLVFFDELMKRVPPDHGATFVAAAQTLQYLSMVVAPLLAPILSEWLGFSTALLIAGGISVFGFVLFLLEKSKPGLEGSPDY